MPRTKLSLKLKSKRKSWTKANMIEAVKAMREKKIHLKKAVKLYRVPKTTLQRFVYSDQPSDELVISENDAVCAQPTNRDDACCIFCSKIYSNDQRGETWIH
ncbi:unnamed protein product [Danaus chrysippus]|uniref:(African queen) hypothetical protein n=1 Tax=Danaus chrysippus TaxID=151541 RepID=A0A8J2QDF2_9NEOP|nr:unnamed protein product [Danaus chrysippus]